jgi:phosphatidylserine/phosphatidylglycerophosphate/cardiolipin synthase-like enzyme
MKRVSFLLALTLVLLACGDGPKGVPAYKEDFCSLIHFDSASGLSKELAPVADSMATKTGVYVLEDGEGAMIARPWLCEHAEQTIDIQYFIFATDNVGLIGADYLVRAADRGIKVRILIDDILVDATPHDILTLDSHENIEIRIYNPGVNIGKNIVGKIAKMATDFKGANQRMHNKTFTVDGKVVITGGRNIADEYFDYDHEFNFRDRDVLLLGKTAGDISNSFTEFWDSHLSVPITELTNDPDADLKARNRFDRLHQYACNPENFWPQVRERIRNIPQAFKEIQRSGKLVWTDSVRFVSDIPGKNHSKNMRGGGNTTAALIDLIRNAQHSVDIQSPYLVVTDEGIRLLAEAVKRGVRIRILTNSLSSNDNLPSFAGYQKIRSRLLEAGVKIYEFKPDAKERYTIMTGALQKKMNYTPIFGLHAKTMVVDGTTTAIGTFNMDPRSANLNTECVTIIKSEKIAAGVLHGMEEEYKPENAWETTLSFNPDAEASTMRRGKTFVAKVLPQKIL